MNPVHSTGRGTGTTVSVPRRFSDEAATGFGPRGLRGQHGHSSTRDRRVVDRQFGRVGRRSTTTRWARLLAAHDDASRPLWPCCSSPASPTGRFVEPKIFTTVVTIVVAGRPDRGDLDPRQPAVRPGPHRDGCASTCSRSGCSVPCTASCCTATRSRSAPAADSSPGSSARWSVRSRSACSPARSRLTDDPARRRIIALVGSLAIGVGDRIDHSPRVPTGSRSRRRRSIYTSVGILVGAGLSLLRKRPPLGGVLTGAALGWIVGALGRRRSRCRLRTSPLSSPASCRRY